MDIDYLRALWKLGRIRPEEVHLAATELLVDGIESPAVVRLAGMTGATFWEIDPVLNEAFLEGNLSPYDATAARWQLAYETARRLVAGELKPLDGATILWDLATDLDLPEPLRYFVYLAADYGEGPGDRASEEAWFDARIIESARELLERNGNVVHDLRQHEEDELSEESFAAICRIPIELRRTDTSLRDTVRASGYAALRGEFSARSLADYLRQHPEFVEEWATYSEDKRGGTSWYFRSPASVGRISQEPPPMRELHYPDPAAACAAFMIAELNEILDGDSVV
jgi:hypothetical protein